MEKLPINGHPYRLQLNAKDLSCEVETIYQISFTKDIIKTISLYKHEEDQSYYIYEDAVKDCKEANILDFKIYLIESDFICYQGKCKIRKVSKHYPDNEATLFKLKIDVIQ